jgi:phosphoglycerol transferase MdoB-like AlkP superfamily enzyme
MSGRGKVLLFYGVSVFLILAKTLAATRLLGYELSLNMILNTTALILIYSAWTLWMGKKGMIIGLAVVNFVLTSALVGDTLFHHYFNRIALWAAHHHIPELNAVTSSVQSCLAHRYRVYLLDLAVMVVLGVKLLRKEHFRGLSFRLRSVLFFPAMVVCAVWLCGQYRTFTKPSTRLQIELERVTHFGIYAYHLFDIIRYNRVSSGAKISAGNMEELQAIHEKQLAEFRQSRDDAWGAAGGKNLVIVLLESTQNFVINMKVGGQEITPNLNRIAREGFYFPNFYSQIGPGSTSDAEFLIQYSLYPLAEEHIFSSYYTVPLQGIPDMLKKRGYHVYLFHGNVETFWSRDRMYGHHGIEKFFDEDDFVLDEIVDLGLSDESFFRQLAGLYGLVISLTSHCPYTIPEGKKELDIPKDFAHQKFINYLHAQHYLDAQIGAFLESLEKQGILDNTLVAFFGDHMTPHGIYGLDLSRIGGKAPNPMEHFKVPFIIRVPPGPDGRKIEGRTIATAAGQIDVMPTLFYLMGIEPEGIFLGKNLITAKENTIALSRFFVAEGSFVSDRFMFMNGYPKNRKCLKIPGFSPTGLEACDKGRGRMNKLLQLSDLIVKSGVKVKAGP